MAYVIGEELLWGVLGVEEKHLLGKIGWMDAVRGITKRVEAYLADPELKLMIVEEQSFRVKATSIANFQAAKKQRADVTFIVIISTDEEEEDLDLFPKAGADYVVHYHAVDFLEHLRQLVDQVFSS